MTLGTTGDLIGAPGTAGDTQALLTGQPLTDTPAPTLADPTTEPSTSGSGMDAVFKARLNALITASGGRLSIRSGYRSTAQQQQLWNAALKKYGSVSAARKWVAPPGHSNHEKGIAADLEGDLALAHRLAPQFGLVFPMAWEEWHIEPVGARSNPQAYTDPPPGYPDPTTPQAQSSTPEHLAAIVQAMHLAPEDQQAVRHPDAASTAPAPVAPPPTPEGGTPIAAPTAPTPAPPAQAGTTSELVAPTTAGGDTAKVLAGEPLTAAPTVDDVNASAGMAGAQGNMSGTGRIQSTPEREGFAKAVLEKAGLPITPENMRVMVAWQQGEGTSAAYNPLATTTGAPGASDFNSVGVKNFTSFEQGVDATVKTIFNGHYADIITALQQGNSAEAVAAAIARSPWGTGGLVLKILGAG